MANLRIVSEPRTESDEATFVRESQTVADEQLSLRGQLLGPAVEVARQRSLRALRQLRVHAPNPA